tara:strand:- start:1010 stop:1123 length:114 start_codon:yes stop_codon:yes gene_type:complete
MFASDNDNTEEGHKFFFLRLKYQDDQKSRFLNAVPID